MLDAIKTTLLRLRSSISNRIEVAYRERDRADTDVEMAYAEGKAHAYSVAETEILRAERAGDRRAGAGA